MASPHSVVVLAVPHQLQGAGFHGYIDDPSYSRLIKDLIAAGVDFVFEEASGRAPSTARDLAESLLGPGHYLDVDPPPRERQKHGIAMKTGGSRLLRAGVPSDSYEWTKLEEQGKREELWKQRVEAQPFQKGLAICGLCHGLSFAFRLADKGTRLVEAYSYIPYHNVCTRPHVS